MVGTRHERRPNPTSSPNPNPDTPTRTQNRPETPFLFFEAFRTADHDLSPDQKQRVNIPGKVIIYLRNIYPKLFVRTAALACQPPPLQFREGSSRASSRREDGRRARLERRILHARDSTGQEWVTHRANADKQAHAPHAARSYSPVDLPNCPASTPSDTHPHARDMYNRRDESTAHPPEKKKF